MSLTGMKRLAAHRASQIAVERHKGAKGFDLVAKIATGLGDHLVDDMRAGMEFAHQAVAAMRAAPDYQPALHGTTDDEIADWISDAAEARMAEQRRALEAKPR